jgi:hypothetical protein
MGISKRDLFHMTDSQATVGRQMWKRTGQQGKLASASFNAEANAPKTWIFFADPKGGEICTIECELMVVSRASDSSEGVLMLLAMCPKCGNNIHIREDNKSMSVEMVPYRKCPKFLQINWSHHCRNITGRPFSEDDLIPVISSPEAWTCDYCKEWCVKVHGGIAKAERSRASTIYVHSRAADGAPNIEF